MTSFSRRQIYSILIAAFFWTAVTASFVLIPVRAAVEEPVYREIRIQLAPLEEKAPEPEPVKVPDPVVEEVAAEPVAAEPALTEAAPEVPVPKVAEPAPAVPAASAPAAKTPVPEPEPAKQTLVKSIDQLMAEQAAAKGSKKSADAVDWDALFGESSTSASSVSTGEKTFVAQQGPSTSGQAAASAADTGTSASAESGKTRDASVSSGTQNALGTISDAAVNGVYAGGSSTGSGASVSESATGSSSNDSGLEWGSGPGRRLISPSKPEISFSEDQKAYITTSVRDIRISFKVRADGTVLRESIMIDKAASLPAVIFQAIERQISEWQFEKGSSDGQAVFLYSIIVE